MPFAVFTYGGSDYDIKNFNLTTSFQKIQFEGKNIKGFLMRTREFNVEVEFKKDSADADTKILTVPMGTPFPGNFALGDGTIGYARAKKGTATLEVIATF